MPMYEYDCKDCGAYFDMLRNFNQADTDVICPTCGSNSVQRKLSVVAAVTKESQGSTTSVSSMPDTGSSCCSGGMCGCSLN